MSKPGKVKYANSTKEEKIEFVTKLSVKLEENFLDLGDLLSQIKKEALYSFKGYEKFADMVEAEWKLLSSTCNKLIKVFELYSVELDMDESRIKKIGFDPLIMIAPVISEADQETQDRWIDKAEHSSLTDLKQDIKDWKEKKKKKKTTRELLVESFLERMMEFLGCTRKTLMFKIALFFMNMDSEALKNFQDFTKSAEQRFDRETGTTTIEEEMQQEATLFDHPVFLEAMKDFCEKYNCTISIDGKVVLESKPEEPATMSQLNTALDTVQAGQGEDMQPIQKDLEIKE